MSLCLCMFAGVAVMSSCGDDDDIDDLNLKTGITEKGNTLTLTVNSSYYTETMTATFDDNDLCTKFITKEIYKSKDVADAAWATYKAEYEGDDEWKCFSKDGKTITIDETEYFKGQSKQEIRQYFESVKDEVDEYYK